MDLVEAIYRLTESFPKTENYGLTSQLRRAAISVPSNLAEGAVGRSKAEFSRFLEIALGSLSELDTQIEIAHRLKYLATPDADVLNQHITDCTGLIIGLRRSLA
jgi:four helix bundle protein